MSQAHALTLASATSPTTIAEATAIEAGTIMHLLSGNANGSITGLTITQDHMIDLADAASQTFAVRASISDPNAFDEEKTGKWLKARHLARTNIFDRI